MENSFDLIGEYHITARQIYFGSWATKVLSTMFEEQKFRSLNDNHRVKIYIETGHSFDTQFFISIVDKLFDVYLVIKG